MISVSDAFKMTYKDAVSCTKLVEPRKVAPSFAATRRPDLSNVSVDDVRKLTYKELQGLCQWKRLPSKGLKKSHLRQRLVAEIKKQEKQEEMQRREELDTQFPLDKIVCFLSKKLPPNPVRAEDGYLYDEPVIQAYIETAKKEDRAITSPATKQLMGDRLFPAPSVKEYINALVDCEVIVDENLVSLWKKQGRQEAAMDALKASAASGDTSAMLKLGFAFGAGTSCVPKDSTVACTWFQKGHAAGCVRATAWLGYCYITGYGVEHTCSVKGMAFIAIAAAKGSDFAAYVLGRALYCGKYGMPVDMDEGVRWLQKSLSQHDCPLQNLTNRERDEAQNILVNHVVVADESTPPN
ncbi:Sel1 repeat [Seminavis robusta]|uniref:Sel1 repeat n=1 Tax=Seminavis robusta TaxID=568900 RepID=A0A9N8H4Q1_9STRA|nr:Sel1 repeat [Seminavis robusta]|eukprot:Sro90_g047430.1 Sel1 repeat (352) ;mRNA; r:85572-86627